MTYDVIIIGSGIAGMAAAYELTNFGAKVCLLEARSRLGGEIYTFEVSGKAIDLGAMYVHGHGSRSYPNPIYPVLERYGIKTAFADVNNSDLRDTKGNPESLLALQSALAPEFSSATFEIQEARRIPYHRPPTVADVLMYHKNNIPKPDSPEYWTRKLITASITQHTYADMADLSILDLQHNRLLEGDDEILLGGYQQLIQGLHLDASHTHNLKTHLNTVVTSIHHDTSEEFLKVETETGKTFSASAVLCALPLNVLKQDRISFRPGLSTEKRIALHHVKMGQQNKVLLEFKKAFWPEEVHYLFPNHPDVDVWPEYLNLDHFIEVSEENKGVKEGKKHHFLMAQFYGKEARFEQKTEREILDICLAPLKRAYKKAKPKDLEPIHSVITHWDSDPYSAGSGVYCAAGCLEKHIEALEKNEVGGLFFANGFKRIKQGLQTTVEGAYDSGVQSALEIRAYLRYRKFEKYQAKEKASLQDYNLKPHLQKTRTKPEKSQRLGADEKGHPKILPKKKPKV